MIYRESRKIPAGKYLSCGFTDNVSLFKFIVAGASDNNNKLEEKNR